MWFGTATLADCGFGRLCVLMVVFDFRWGVSLLVLFALIVDLVMLFSV